MKKTILSWGGTLMLFLLSFTFQAQAQCKDDCFEIRFVSATPNIGGVTTRLRFSVQTTCGHDLSYIAFELPAGQVAYNPSVENYKFVIDDANKQGVTWAPFYSIKFEVERIQSNPAEIIAYFSYDINTLEYIKMTSMRIKAKASTREGTVTFSKPEGGLVFNNNCPLPVTLSSFNGVSRNGSVELTWSTASEINNERFEVERSIDGRTFTKVGEVKGNGNSTAVIDYSFTDLSATSGAVYYRLRQVDYDGASENSKVIAVSHSAGAGNAAMSVYPNPVTDGKFVIRFTEQIEEGASIRLIDLNGQVLHTSSLNESSTETEINLSGLNLKQGLYLITVTSNNQSSTQRIMIY